MSRTPQIITHQGHDVLFVDNAHLPIEDIKAQFPLLVEKALGTGIRLTCVDVTGVPTDDSLQKAQGQARIKTEAVLGPTYTAIIGVKGIPKAIANMLQKGQYFADDREEALDWLVKQIEKEAKQ